MPHTEKLQLPTVTLLMVDCVSPYKAAKVLDHCKSLCDFGVVKFLTSADIEHENLVKIQPLTSLVQYSIFMLSKSHEYVETSHVLTVQCDGWILNPQSFKQEWLELDFIGGLFMQTDEVGSGGFSLRSKRIMQDVSKTIPNWDGTPDHANQIQHQVGLYEDGVLSISKFAKGYKIATPEQGADFSQAGNRNPNYFREYSFGYHRTWQVIDFKTGRVDSSDTTKDIHISYDAQIDLL